MGLTLLPHMIIIIFIHSPGSFPGTAPREVLKDKAVALYAAQALRKPRPCSLPLSSPCADNKNGELGTQGWFQMLERRQLEHTLIFPPAWDLSKASQENIIKSSLTPSPLKSKAYSKACPFHNFLKTTVENPFFAANRINNVSHKWSRISFLLIQLGANCQHENFQLN